jgi:riboflavin kinase/FMN adenylyltransferase
VLAPDRAPKLLATVDQRIEGLDVLGVDVVRVLTFDEALARETARDFIRRVLIDELHARVIVVGEDFRFGHNREGSVALLKEVGVDHDFEVEPTPLYGEPVRWSSTAVREALSKGDLESARWVLGHPFRLRANVRHGDQRGRELGFPTANLALGDHQQLPGEGVYAGFVTIGSLVRPCAISIGTRPQYYAEGELLVELYVLDFTGDLYDRVLEVTFLARLREQATFSTGIALSHQIARDVEETRAIFDKFSLADPTLLG